MLLWPPSFGTQEGHNVSFFPRILTFWGIAWNDAQQATSQCFNSNVTPLGFSAGIAGVGAVVFLFSPLAGGIILAAGGAIAAYVATECAGVGLVYLGLGLLAWEIGA